jgi:hypothetical protein
MRCLKHGHPARMLAMGGMAAALGVLIFAPSAMASSHNPKGEFAQFAECPLSNAKVTDCIYSLTTGGSFTVGSKTVPLVNPATLQGGGYTEGEKTVFVGAENGDTLSKTPQPVPGGLVGVTAPKWWPLFLQNWFNNLISEGFTGVNATVELAAPASAIGLSTNNLVNQEGTALGLPVKVKLENFILGNNCYLGSNKNPIQIDFTTGKSGSLEGVVGEITFNESFSIVTITGSKLVNGTFEAPGVSGCGGIFSLFVDPLVDTVLGTPSASGNNTAVLEGKLQAADAGTVKASE